MLLPLFFFLLFSYLPIQFLIFLCTNRQLIKDRHEFFTLSSKQCVKDLGNGIKTTDRLKLKTNQIEPTK